MSRSERKGWSLCWLLVFGLVCRPARAFIEPVSWGMVAAGAGIFAGFAFLRCRWTECCNSDAIVLDMAGLKKDLHKRLHGQHLAVQVILGALQSHLNPATPPKKPLVMSFHGWTGSGKNYASQIIAESLYKKGMKSQFVHHFMAHVHFNHANRAHEYQEHIKSRILWAVFDCKQSLFIFDEVDKMPPTVIDAIKSFLDDHVEVGGINFNKAIFIFLSNTGGDEINDVAFKFWKDGKVREFIFMGDMEPLIRQGAFNEAGGLQGSIKNNVNGFLVPFLPLERQHVMKCAEDELRNQKLEYNRQLVEKVADMMEYDPEKEKVFSKSGCKLVWNKLVYVMD